MLRMLNKLLTKHIFSNSKKKAHFYKEIVVILRKCKTNNFARFIQIHIWIIFIYSNI